MFHEKIINNIFNHNDIPNVILYGHHTVNNKKEYLISKLEELYDIVYKNLLIKNEIEYIITNLYYEFNMKNINNKNMDTFLEIIKNIINNKNYYNKYSNKIIILNNFKICMKIQNIFRVIFEKYRITTVFIIITDDYNSIIEPLRSRCISIRIPNITKKEKRRILHQEISYKNISYKNIDTNLYDKIYEINNKKEIEILSKFKEIYDNNYETPYYKITTEILTIYNKGKFNKEILDKIKEISFNILKYLNVNYFYFVFLSVLLSKNTIRDKTKYKIIYIFSNNQYQYTKSYRSILVVESLLIDIFNLLAA